MKGLRRIKNTLFSFTLVISLLLLNINITPLFAQEESNADINEEIIYDILIDRFNNGDQKHSEQIRLDDPYAFHGGDIEGIIMKLDSIKELGYTTLSLSPMMANAKDGYHGYWIEDFYEVDEQFGSMDDMKTLVEEAHERGLKVVLELVTNYISETNPIVNDSDKEDWIDENKEAPVDEYPWLEKVVTLNQENPEVLKYFKDVADYWLDETGIDGYKLHAADEASPTFLNKLADHIRETKEDAYILADVLVDDSSQLNDIESIQLVKNTDMFKSMTTVFSEADKPVSDLFEEWEQIENKSGLLYLDDKYTKRFTQRFVEKGRNKVTAWTLALTYMYTTPGVPLIYQGSEIPEYGAGVPENQKMVNFNSGDTELNEFIERISALRAEFPPLTHGDYEMIDSDEGMSVFKRTYHDETVYIAINNDSESRAVLIDSLGEDKQLRGLLGDNLVREDKNGDFRIGIPRETAEVYIVENNTGINWFFIGSILAIFFIFIGAVIYLSRKQKKREAQ